MQKARRITDQLSTIRKSLADQLGEDDLGLSLADIPDFIPESDTVLECDEWTRRRGKEIHKGALGKECHSDELSPLDLADLHAMLYERMPEFSERPSAEIELRRRFIDGVLKNTATEELRNMTSGSVWATEVSMPSMAGEYFALVQKMKDLEEERKKAQEKGKPVPEDVQKKQDENAIGAAAAAAVRKATDQAEEAETTAEAFGLDDGEGGNTDFHAIRKIMARAAKSERLRSIINEAGRFKELAKAKQRKRNCYGFDTVVGITPSDDVSRLVASELAALSHPLLRYDAMRRLAEKQMMCREHKGVERVAKGPIMVWVDESGSMSGERISTAKGLALAMAWVARKQKRWCSLVGFSSARQIRTVTLPPGRWNEGALIEWCEGFYNGGTQVPFDEAESLFAKTGAPRGKTDILLVTDGETNSDDKMRERFLAWKKSNRARLISLVIDCDGSTVGPYSDEMHLMKSLSTAEDGVVAAVSV